MVTFKMRSKYRYRFAARLLPPVALLAAMLLIFSGCSFLRSPDDTAALTQTAAPTDTVAPIETVTQTEPETTESETTAPSADRTGEEIYQAHSELTPVN